MKKCLLIDGNSILYRSFYALPLLSNSKGIYTNAVYGFLNMMFKFIEEDKPDYLAVCFDLPEKTKRHERYEAYKQTRKAMPEEMRPQVALLQDVLGRMGIQMYHLAGYEADDLLGTLARQAKEEGVCPLIISGDRDMLQLVSDELKIKIPKTKGGKTTTEIYGLAEVMEQYLVSPKEFIDVKALMGDSSDNVPGVPGIGEKTAIKIISQYKSLDAVYDHIEEFKGKQKENLIAFKDQAYLSRELVTIDCYAPVSLSLEDMTINMYTKEAYEILLELEFRSFAEKFMREIEQTQAVTEKVFIPLLEEEKDILLFLEALQTHAAYAFLWEEGRWNLAVVSHGQQAVLRTNNIELIRKFFESDIKKIAFTIKRDLHILKRWNIKANSYLFDAQLAFYILNPVKQQYGADQIAHDFLKRPPVFYKDDAKEETKLRKLLEEATILFDSYPVLVEKLEKNQQTFLYEQIEFPLIFVLYEMENNGIEIDKKSLFMYGEELNEQMKKLEKEIFSFVGEEFNLNSPKQLGQILFEKLNLPGGKKNKTGYSTAADILDRLAPDYPFVKQIVTYRQLSKLKSTYIDGLLPLIDEKTSRIYTTFQQTVTATGRLSSVEPNLQNIPIKLEIGKQLRKVFVAGSGHVFLDADYSQIELRVLAHLSQDEHLKNAFTEDLDIHRETASRVFHVDEELVSESMRGFAKAVNFGIIYGIGAFSLSQDLQIPRKQAEKYINSYFEAHPQVKEYLEASIQSAEKTGEAVTMFYRKRAVPELFSNNFNERNFGKRVAMNMPIQGSAADIMKLAMIVVDRELRNRQMKSRMILQVHDELLLECPETEKDAVKQLLKKAMEEAAVLNVGLKVEISEGRSWYEC